MKLKFSSAQNAVVLNRGPPAKMCVTGHDKSQFYFDFSVLK